jgi:C4-type Zn-finger protein
MGGKRVSTIEKILHRVEDHIEEWRKQDHAR